MEVAGFKFPDVPGAESVVLVTSEEQTRINAAQKAVDAARAAVVLRAGTWHLTQRSKTATPAEKRAKAKHDLAVLAEHVDAMNAAHRALDEAWRPYEERVAAAAKGEG